MVYSAHPQVSPLATSERAAAFSAFSAFSSASSELSSSLSQARQLGHPNVRKRAAKTPVVHHPARHRPHLPPGVEDQPF